MEISSDDNSGQKSKNPSLSYKFQRLREQLRQAVVSGEFAGKLPGERILAKRFNCNAKTLSKALTDLAAEGLLDRNIGRGTYVRIGIDGADGPKQTNWLILADPGTEDATLVKLIQQATPASTVVTQTHDIRPSFLKPFDAVINISTRTPESFLKELVVRNIQVVSANREMDVMSMDTVSCDRVFGASLLTRDLALAGHTDLLVVESLPRSPVLSAVKQSAERYGGKIHVNHCSVEQAHLALRDKPGVVIVDSTATAKVLRKELETRGINFPGDVSLTAIGCCDENYPCSGYFADCRVIAQTIVDIIKSGPSTRPSVLWIAPRFIDAGTLAKPNVRHEDAA